MSSEAIKWARNQSFGSLSLKALVSAIAARADSKGCTWASQQTLARDVGASDRHVRTLLALLETLGAISRTARSAGCKGRLTDAVTLAIHRTFDLTPSDIKAKKKLRPADVATGTAGPLVPGCYNRNRSTLATGTRVPGNRKRITYPSQGERHHLSGYSAAPAPAPRLVVVGGTALVGEGDR